jgi:dolichol-phosphate mannosyltransferase
VTEPDSDPPLTIVVFAYNERESIQAVLAELGEWLDRALPATEVVFVDDGSTDGTADAAERALVGRRHAIVRRATNGGIGAALKDGVRAARGPYVTFLPADGQIAPASIGTLYETATATAADVVLSVYDHRDDGLDRTVLSFGVRALITVVHGVRVASDGPYLFRRSLFVPADLPPDSFFLNFEFPIRVVAAGLTVETVTIPCRPRRSGVSKSKGLLRIRQVATDLFELRVRRTRAAFERARGRRL